MSRVSAGEHPMYVLRTRGGLYEVTQDGWQKTTSFRMIPTVDVTGFRPHGGGILVTDGVDPRERDRVRMTPVTLDEITPGFHRYRFQGRGMHNFVRTSPIITVYRGDEVEEITPEGRFLVSDRLEAWVISGDHGFQLLSKGADTAEGAVDVPALLDRLDNPRILRIDDETGHPNDLAAVETEAPAWVPLIRSTTNELEAIGVRVRGMGFDQYHYPLIDLHLTGSPTPTDDESDAWVQVRHVLDDFEEACRGVCQVCGVEEPEMRMVATRYRLVFAMLCDTCRAIQVTAETDATLPGDGHTPLWGEGEDVTVWRSDAGLFASTAEGYTQLVDLRRTPSATEFHAPRMLALPAALYEIRSLPDTVTGNTVIRGLTMGTHAALPGMTVELHDTAGSEPTGFTVLDLHHGTTTRSTEPEPGEVLLVFHRAKSRQSRAWLVAGGVSSRLYAGGHDGVPEPGFDLAELLTRPQTETGIIRVASSLSGASRTRDTFRMLAPAWMPHLNTCLREVREEELPVTLIHAGVHPLTGVPTLRFNGVGAPSEQISGVRALVQQFQRACVATCQLCGDPAHPFRVPAPAGRGFVQQFLCIPHGENELTG